MRVTCSNYYIPSWHGKLVRVSRRIFLSLSLLPPEKIRLARETTVVHVQIATEDLKTLHPGVTGLCFIKGLVGDIDRIN